ncbi:hypothetical protein Tco_0782656 [Tanacetum coccineum]
MAANLIVCPAKTRMLTPLAEVHQMQQMWAELKSLQKCGPETKPRAGVAGQLGVAEHPLATPLAPPLLDDVMEVVKQIDLNKEVIKSDNEFESDTEDVLPKVADPIVVVEEVTGKITCDFALEVFCYE